jgi:tetratricopeptide (TPR) repeat protein
MAANPSNPEELYATFLTTELAGLSSAECLEVIGGLIDLSGDLGKPDGAHRALELSDLLEATELPEADAALLEYFRANAWSVLQRHEATNLWDWEQPALGKQIFYLRKCVCHTAFSKLDKLRRCQVFTNLGNCMDTVGRFIEAQEYWRQALILEPRFGMAVGNKGCGLEAYARALHDPGHQMLFVKFAHTALKMALGKKVLFDGVYPQALVHFESVKNRIESLVPNLKKVKLHDHPMGKTEAERTYRAWCLENRLFLNPLNDLGSHSVANRDIVMLPTFTTKANEPPTLVGFFNQLKQEYVSARWLLYEGTQTEKMHFSDRDVLLYNTLDYSCHALSVEKTRIAFRMAYSLFDKLAFFLNEYLQLGTKDRDVYFKTIWYQHQQRSSKHFLLKPKFINLDNLAFRGLFWLAKDLFDEQYSDVIEPEARDFYVIRNRLEHSSLRVYEDFATGLPSDLEIFSNRLAYSITRGDLNAKTLRLFKLVRAAMIYLLLGMHREEARRVHDETTPAFPMEITTLEDDWKQ